MGITNHFKIFDIVLELNYFSFHYPNPAISNPRPCLGFRCSEISDVLTTCPCFENLELDIFYAGGFQCHCITSVTIAVKIRILSVH